MPRPDSPQRGGPYLPVRRLACALALAAATCTGVSCNAIDGWSAYDEIGQAMREPALAGRAFMDVRGRVPIVHLYGTPDEMGRQYGLLLGEPLRALRRYMYAFLPKASRERLLAYAARHEPALPGEMREELRALAEASRMPYLELVALNIVPKLSCSTLAMWGEAAGKAADAADGDAGLILGRNADYFSMGFSDRGMLVVVRHPTEGIPSVSVNFLGMIGAFTGMNASGVAYGNLLVFNADGPQHADGAMPIQLALRLAAERAATADEMADRLRAQRHVIPMNVALADRTKALVVELGLAGTAVREGDRGVLIATNHFRTPSLRAYEKSCSRYRTLEAAAERYYGRMTVEQMKKCLHAARILTWNLQAVVFEPGAMRMHLSINHVPASAGPYVVLDLPALFARRPAHRVLGAS